MTKTLKDQKHGGVHTFTKVNNYSSDYVVLANSAGTQVSATLLDAEFNVVSGTVANASVILPIPTTGTFVVVKNTGSYDVRLFTQQGHFIWPLAQDTALTLNAENMAGNAPGDLVMLWCHDGYNWTAYFPSLLSTGQVRAYQGDTAFIRGFSVGGNCILYGNFVLPVWDNLTGSLGGTAIRYGLNIFTGTVPNGTASLTTVAREGYTYEVYNFSTGSDALWVFPPSGGKINTFSQNVPIALRPGEGRLFRSRANGVDYAMVSSSAGGGAGTDPQLSGAFAALSTSLVPRFETVSSSYSQFSATLAPLVGQIMNTPGAEFGDCVNADNVVVGSIAYVKVPYSGTITRWDMVADVACSATIDIWKSSSRPTVVNTIVGSSMPGLNSTDIASDETLSGWSRSVAKGDTFAFKLNTLSGGSPTQISITLKVS